ncbi:MAG: response regulator, partial [Chloroflexota bacterium]
MNIKPIRVLVVEDDLHLLNGIRDILELDDYHVLTAMNGQEALTVLRSDPYNPPDVIVSDVMMPKMNGFKFLEEVRNEKLWLNVPFIFLTAKGEQTDRHKGSMLGADRYLTKPFDAPDLQVAVSATLKR